MNSGIFFRGMAYGRRSRDQRGGFTLIELMVVVAIIGLLASVAVPSFMRNAKKAKSSEALVQLSKIYTSSRTYILELHSAVGTGVTLPTQFPDPEAITPAQSCCTFTGQKCVPAAGTWATPTWSALQFTVDMPHYYRYAYASTGSANPGPGSNFHAQAYGDLNCDTKYSTFELYGEWNNLDHDVHGSAGFYTNDPLE